MARHLSRIELGSVIDHLRRLGVTATSFPVHAFVDDVIWSSGISTLWGYNTLGFSRPNPLRRRERAGGIPRDGVAAARRRIEVILDVVYNHTAGATISARR